MRLAIVSDLNELHPLSRYDDLDLVSERLAHVPGTQCGDRRDNYERLVEQLQSLQHFLFHRERRVGYDDLPPIFLEEIDRLMDDIEAERS